MYKISFGILYFLIGILLAIILSPLIAHSDSPPPNSPILYKETIVEPHRASQHDDKVKIEEAVMRYCPIEQRGMALYIIEAESQFTLGQSRILDPKGPNGREDSWGPAQINLFWNPSITRSQAQNIDFSINFLCTNLVAGNGRLWSTFPLR